MNRIKTIIIEDEPLPQKRLRTMVDKNQELNLIGVFDDPIEAIEIMSSGQVQLIFSDIQMPELDGISFIKSLKSPPFIVFVTAYSQYATEGFELDVIDYIMKPLLTEERLLKSVEKVKQAISYQKSTRNSHDIKIKDRHKTIFISPMDIFYVHAYGDYVKLYTKDGERVILSTMKALEINLPSNDFIRIHRSFMINIHSIKAVEATKVSLKDADQDIPIGLQYRDAFFKFIGIDK